MAEIHRKGSIIKKRMGTWKRKVEPKPKNVHVERLKEGGKVIGGVVWSGLKNLGRELAKPETQKRIGDIGYNMGQMGREQFAFGAAPRRKKGRKGKKRR